MRPPGNGATSRLGRWAGYAAAGWAILFAIRGTYWALGGTVGLGTLSQGIRRAAAEGDRSLFAALWVTVALEVFAAGLALTLAKSPGQRLSRRLPLVGGRRIPDSALLLLAFGAGALLAVHGGLFLSFGLFSTSDDAYWYTRFWGPWFLLGGILFLVAAWTYLRKAPNRSTATVASVLGVLGGLAAAAAPLIVSSLAAPA